MSANINDSILIKYGLSNKYFDIVLVKDAPKGIFRNLSSDAIKQTDTIIIAKVDTFENTVNIKGKTVKHRLVLSGKVFKKGVSFYMSKFEKEVYMNECQFYERVDFSNAIFDSTLILWRTYFNKAGVFTDATFNGLQFMDTQFEEDVQFHEVNFKGATFLFPQSLKKGHILMELLFMILLVLILVNLNKDLGFGRLFRRIH